MSNLVWPGYQAYWNSAEKKGYSGTVIFTKTQPLNVTQGMGISEHDREGRIVTAAVCGLFPRKRLRPQTQNENSSRLPYRQEWDRDFLAYLKGLEGKKPVIFCGDLNAAHRERDLARPKDNVRTHGFTGGRKSWF